MKQVCHWLEGVGGVPHAYDYFINNGRPLGLPNINTEGNTVGTLDVSQAPVCLRFMPPGGLCVCSNVVPWL